VVFYDLLLLMLSDLLPAIHVYLWVKFTWQLILTSYRLTEKCWIQTV